MVCTLNDSTGERFYQCFIDTHSNYIFAKFSVFESEAFNNFKELRSDLPDLNNHYHSDGGEELIFGNIREYCIENKIRVTYTASY